MAIAKDWVRIKHVRSYRLLNMKQKKCRNWCCQSKNMMLSSTKSVCVKIKIFAVALTQLGLTDAQIWGVAKYLPN